VTTRNAPLAEAGRRDKTINFRKTEEEYFCKRGLTRFRKIRLTGKRPGFEIALFRPSTSLIHPPANGRILTGVIDTERTVSRLKLRIFRGVGFVAATGLTLLFSYLMSRLTQAANSHFIDKQIKAFQPDIEASLLRPSLLRQRRKIFSIAASGGKARP
jgi:hypothetical protein